MHRSILAALVLGAIYSTRVGANAFISGGDLNELCNEPGEACDAYIMGVMDTVDRTESLTGASAPYCFSEVTSEQVNEIVTKFLSRHPAKWDSSAADMVVASLAEEFPCKQAE